MGIVLKLACFTIWLVMMLYLINGHRRKTSPRVRTKILLLSDGEDVEKCIRQNIKNLCIWDRLVIKDATTSWQDQLIISRMLQRNPSILYISTETYSL
ncbi:MAG: hypothetical protein ACOX6I_07360 [Syntrophomonadaceae bacterium]|jgi:hypothetical protein